MISRGTAAPGIRDAPALAGAEVRVSTIARFATRAEEGRDTKYPNAEEVNPMWTLGAVAMAFGLPAKIAGLGGIAKILAFSSAAKVTAFAGAAKIAGLVGSVQITAPAAVAKVLALQVALPF